VKHVKHSNSYKSLSPAILAVLLVSALTACGGGEDPAPVGDRDGDGFLDTLDSCPDVAENQNGYLDLDGCPDTPPQPPPPPPADSDRDGIPDASDSCPTQPETQNGYQDSDGCPDTVPVQDADGDGIADGSDSCPSAREVVNNYQDTDGCPDVSPRFAGRWVGDVFLTLQGEPEIRYTGSLSAQPNGASVTVSTVCPNGDGVIATNSYTDQFRVGWRGTLSCSPVAFPGGCQSVVFTFNDGAFVLDSPSDELGAAGGGTATGCGVSKPFIMSFGGTRQ
jgi:hypothetical protein